MKKAPESGVVVDLWKDKRMFLFCRYIAYICTEGVQEDNDRG